MLYNLFILPGLVILLLALGWVEIVVTLRFCTCASYDTIMLKRTEEERVRWAKWNHSALTGMKSVWFKNLGLGKGTQHFNFPGDKRKNHKVICGLTSNLPVVGGNLIRKNVYRYKSWKTCYNKSSKIWVTRNPIMINNIMPCT